jgi:hypothetical protein
MPGTSAIHTASCHSRVLLMRLFIERRMTPTKAIGVAFGTGVLLGAVTAMVCGTRCGSTRKAVQL